MLGTDKELRMRLEEVTLALHTSEARFRSVITRSDDGIVIVDESGVIRFVNPAAEALFGRSEKKLLGETFGSPIVSGETTELDIVRSGVPAVVEVRVTETEWEGRSARLLTMRDITERRQSEKELRKMYRAVLESPGMVMITDSRGLIEFVNPKFTEVTGYTLPEVAGKDPGFLKSGQEPADLYHDMRKTIQAGREWRGELVSSKKDGELFWQSVAISPITDFEGDIINFVGIMEDITDRKRAEEKIEKLNADLAARAAELEAANQELEAFNYSVAHDLRGPLNIISSYCQLIQEICGTSLDESCKEYLTGTYNGTMRMSRLIDALLRFSSIAHIELHRKTVDLSTLAQEIAAELNRTSPGRRCTFRIPGGINADGDPDLFRIVIGNLMNNAWKYTGLREEPIIEFGATDVSGECAYFVRDNGAGFAQADAVDLFLPFRRLHGPEQFKGFGIGLATVARIIRRHGGVIWAEGEPDKGAIFYFTLPAG